MYYIIEIYDEDLHEWVDHSEYDSMVNANIELEKLMMNGNQVRIVKSKKSMNSA